VGQCPQVNINTPDTLSEVISQIEETAKASQQQLLVSLSSRDWRWIRKNAKELQKRVKKQIANHPFSRKEKATFKKFKSKFEGADQESIRCSLNIWFQLTDKKWLDNLRSLPADHLNA
jgi:hypothetical protein